MSKYKEIKDLEYNMEFDGFRSFIKSQLFDKFDFLQEDFTIWRSKNNTKDDLDDLNAYIPNVLTKRISKHINKTQRLINEYEALYFSSEDA